MKKTISVFVMLFLLHPRIMNASVTFAAENRIKLVTYKSKNSPDVKLLNLIYTEAFRRMGMIFVYKKYPAARCSAMSDAGKVDGELSRIYSYGEAHPNVIRVEEHHWRSGFIAVAAAPSIHLDGWESLKGSGYRVNYTRGIKGCEINLPKVVRPENLEKVNSVFQGYKKLLKGRAHIYVGAEFNIMRILESDDFRHSKLRIAGVMEKFTAHVFLHNKHKALVPQLSNILKEMKKEGLFETYRETAKLITYFKN